MESIEEPIPLTAAQVATEHFTRELLSHSKPDSEAETVVILHDACYGHRWSRLKTSKSSLSMIVERPERIHASILGASTAYVRLGAHHAGAQHAPHPDHQPVTKPPFQIRRSGRSLAITSPYVTNVHGTAWMTELQRMCHSAGGKLAAGEKELDRRPAPGETEAPTLHQGDLYLAIESLDAFQGALGGVADAVDAIFTPESSVKRAFVAVRPPGHHCSADVPSGFCWLNNVHVGIEYAAQVYGLTHAAILDFDLHHGDGSQAITWERNSANNVKRLNAKNNKQKLGPDIGYYSIHDINSYPCEMGDDEKVQAASLCIENAHGQSIWNVHLQPWKTEEDFWRLYEDRYRVLLDKAKVFLQHHSDRIKSEGKVKSKAAIFISAGFDASEWEGSGMQRHKVYVPTDFYARFTQDVVKLAEDVEGCEGRVISVLEGGYSDRALCSGVLSHLSGLCATPVTPLTKGVGALMDLSSQMTGLSINGLGLSQPLSYDKKWWSAENLTALEMKVNPPPPPQGKKVRTGPQPTYATPTESFAYKVVDTDKFARSIAGTMREGPVSTRAPTPPPPEVDWVVATQELSKLLIPVDRQTKSFTAEELGGVRVKKEPTAPAYPSGDAAQPRQLRDRKAKGPLQSDSASDDLDSVRSRPESKASRRETITVLPSATPVPQRRASRRLSDGSALDLSSDLMDANAPPVPVLPSAFAGAANLGMKPPPVPSGGSQINHKKVRAPAKPRKPTTSAPASPRKGASTSTVPARQTTGAESSAAAVAGKVSDGLDSLTAGMKKVTLKVSATKEEHDAKQKTKLDAERRARALKAAETRRINTAAKKAAVEGAARASALSMKTAVGSAPSAPVAGSSLPVPKPAVFTGPIAQQSQVKENNEPMTGHGTTAVAQSSAPTSRPGFVDSMTAVQDETTNGPSASGLSQAPTQAVTLDSRTPMLVSSHRNSQQAPTLSDSAATDRAMHDRIHPVAVPSAGNSYVPHLPPLEPAVQQVPQQHIPKHQFPQYQAPQSQIPQPEILQPHILQQQHQQISQQQFPTRAPSSMSTSSVNMPPASNTATPPPARAPVSRHNTLPVFSSTGSIPFSAVPPKPEQDKSIWDIPDTPAKQ